MYEFTQKITVDTRNGAKAFEGGDQIKKTDILEGCFDSLTRQNILVPVAMQAAPVEAPAVEAPIESAPVEVPAEQPKHHHQTHGKGRR